MTSHAFFAFDSRDLLSVWLLGTPTWRPRWSEHLTRRWPSRIQARVALEPVMERERFAQLIAYDLRSAACQHTLLAASGMDILR